MDRRRDIHYCSNETDSPMTESPLTAVRRTRPRALVAATWAPICAIVIVLTATGCTSTPIAGGVATEAVKIDTQGLAYSDPAPPFGASSLAADLDGDGVDETAWLGRGAGAIMIADGPYTYSARTKWVVVQATVADTDHDGLPEVVALVEDEEGRHVGLFAWRHDRYRERLVTSELVPTPAEMEIYHDSSLGGDVVQLFGETGRGITYRWNGFGFTAVEGSG